MGKEVKQNPEEILAEKIDGLQRRREWKQLLLGCLFLVLALYIIFRYVVGIAVVTGKSMEPALEQGELVVFYRLERDYGNGDIVLVRRENFPQEVKRIAACGKAEIEQNEEGLLVIDGEVCLETEPAEGGVKFPYDVPEGGFFILGDNRKSSEDSRNYGAVGEDEIVGRVFVHLGLTK